MAFDDGSFRCDVATRHAGVTLTLVEIAPTAPERLACLSREEQARAERFRSDEDRLRFSVTRAALRQILAEATGRDPKALVFATGPHGKPRLRDTALPYFNVSHSGALALIGVSHLRPIGVDLEKRRDIPEMLAIAEAWFSAADYRALADLPPREQKKAFFAIWVGKEAVLKALGTGIGEGLRDFTVAPAGRDYSLAATGRDFARKLAGVTLERLVVADDYESACALARD